MTVISTITDMWAPVAEFKKDEEFKIEVEVNATGSGTSRLFIGIFDNLLGKYLGAWATIDPQPPRKFTWTINCASLEQGGYPAPIPGILNWKIVVGYMEGDRGIITDNRNTKVPRIVDRICNRPFCVGVSNPYPAPGEEIAISGREVDAWTRPEVDLLTDHMWCARAEVRRDYFRFIFNAPRFEGGYTYFVSTTWKPEYSAPVGIWVSALPTCEDYITKEECEAAGCYWYGNACHSEPPRCEDILTEAECIAAGCYWYNNSCHSSPQSFWNKHKKELMLLGGAGAGVVGIMTIGKIATPRRKTKGLIMEKNRQRSG